MFTILNDIRESLKNNADPQILASSARYHKEGEAPKVYGVGMANVGKIAKEAFKQIKHLPKQEIFELCEGLWQTGYLEESVVACVWAESLHKQYEPADFKIFEHWVHDCVTNWADCDTLCNHTVGSFVTMYPEYVVELKKWAKSPRRFVKRAGAVTLIIPARKGLFLGDVFESPTLLFFSQQDLADYTGLS